MPNILSSQGLDINNITQVGVAGILQSNFLISPAEGYFIAESQFSIDEDYLEEILENNAEITSITFSNTTIGFAADNKVNVNITWAANTTLTDDIDFNLVIKFDDVNQVYDVNSTLVEVNIAPSLNNQNADTIWGNVVADILPFSNIPGVAQVSNFNFISNPNPNYPNQDQGIISFAATQEGPLMVCDVRFKASSTEGMRSFINDPTIIFVASNIPNGGEFDWNLIETINDQFDNVYSYIFRLTYTRDSEGPSEVQFDGDYSCFQNSSPYSITNVGNNQMIVGATGAGDALDGAGTSTSEASKTFVVNNIPSDDVTFTFNAVWAQAGDASTIYLGGNQYEYFFDVNAIDVGVANRTLTVEVRDNKYPLILRTSFTIYQQETAYILLKIATDNVDAIELLYDNYVDSGYDSNFTSNEAVFTSTGKIISHVSPLATEWEAIPSDNGPQPIFVYGGDETLLGETQGITHYVYAFTNTNVTLEQMQEIPLNIIQDQYPIDSPTPKDWVIPQSTGWDQVGGQFSGMFKHPIAIRNQDRLNHLGGLNPVQSARTATLSIVHPLDASTSSTATIEQDGTYSDGTDTIDVRIGRSNVAYSALSSGDYTEDPPSIPSDIGEVDTFRLYVRISSPSSLTEFNMRNLLSPDKQYPPPWNDGVYNSGSFTTVDGDFVGQYTGGAPTTWLDPDDFSPLEFNVNPNYDATDADNNYQYYVDYATTANNSFEQRYWRGNILHPQNRFFVPSNYTMSGGSGVVTRYHYQQAPAIASFTGIQGSEVYLNWGEGTQQTEITAFFTGSTPTIGIWDELTEQYFALAPGATTLDGFSYGLTLINDNEYTLTCSYPENTPNNERSTTLGIWHSSSSTAEFPNDAVTISQYAQPFNEANFWVLSHTESEFAEQTSAAGSVTIYFQISDFDAADAAANPIVNFPTVQIKRWNGVGVDFGEYTDNDGNYDDLGILPTFQTSDLVVNPNWENANPGQDFTYTHSLVVNYSEYTGNEPYYFVIKARHQYEQDYSAENHSFVTISPSQVLSLNSQVWIDTGDGNFVPNSTFLPSNTERVKLRLTYSSYFDSTLYPSDLSIPATDTTNYTYARFLNAAALESGVTHVFAEDSGSEYDNVAQENIPLMFATGPDKENSTHIIDKPFQLGKEGFTVNDNVNNNTNNATPQVVPYPTARLDVVLNVRQNDTGSAITSRIGFWKGDNVPKTNLINTNYGFNFGGKLGPYTSSDCVCNFLDPTAQGTFTANNNIASMHHLYNEADTTGYDASTIVDANSITSVINDIRNRNVYNPIQSLEYYGTGIYDGFTWNIDSTSSYPTFSNNNGEVTFRFLIFQANTSNAGGEYEDANFQYDAINSVGQTIRFGRNKLLGVSFEVEDFEKFDANMSDADVRCGFLIGADQSHAFNYPGVGNAQSDQNNYNNAGIGDTWTVPNNITSIQDVTQDYLNTFRNALSFSSNGKYEGVILTRGTNNASCINFVARAKAKFRVKNIKVWQIRNDLRIRPNGSAIAFGTTPDAQIKLTLASITQLIKFGTTGYLGSPLANNINDMNNSQPDDGEGWVIEANSDAATFNGQTNEYLIDIENSNNYASPSILVWDGTNSSSISTIDWIIGFVDYIQGGNYGAFAITFANNFTDATRSVTLGIWPGNPASDTTAPEDTFTITQNPWLNMAP